MPTIYAPTRNDLDLYKQALVHVQALHRIMQSFSTKAFAQKAMDAFARQWTDATGTDCRLKETGIADGDYATEQSASVYTQTVVAKSHADFNCS